MKKVILSAVLAAMILSVTGCSEKPTEDVKTVDYYKTNPEERKAMIDECKNNPGELKDTPNCVNAVTAMRTGGIKPDPRTATDATEFDKFK